jgi:peptidoglycan/LPS O-acetylase OafA/YrhL
MRLFPEASGTARQRSGYIPSLDGWRALSILAVMCCHSELFSVGRLNDSWLQMNGGDGVEMFFALSGILICSRLLKEETKLGAISLRSFYTRRLFRIQPAALSYLAILSLVMLWQGRFAAEWGNLAGGALMVRNFLPLSPAH